MWVQLKNALTKWWPQPGDYKLAMAEMMLDSASLTGAVVPDIEVVGQNQGIEVQEDGAIKEWSDNGIVLIWA